VARIRTIKPEFWKHEDLSALPEPTHMLAAALLNHADDEGYFNANPGLVKSECCPLREPSVSIQDSLISLVKIGYLALYKGTDGKRYGKVVTFDDHQRVNRPTASKIKPLCTVIEDSLNGHAYLTEPSPPEGRKEGKGKEQGKEGKEDDPTDHSSAAKAADCPHETIIDLYHELLPACPKIKVWNGSRAQHLKTRWREDSKRQSLDYWRRLFSHIGRSDFLMGRVSDRDRRPFLVSLDWIVKPENFAKIIEGKYHHDA
jgi:hypothetical protein